MTCAIDFGKHKPGEMESSVFLVEREGRRIGDTQLKRRIPKSRSLFGIASRFGGGGGGGGK